MPKKIPTVSIVIPAYNEAETIERCLESCLNQTVKASEIIVVNNLSTDETVRIVRRVQRTNATGVPIRLLNQSIAQGITPTRNYGFDRAKGEVIGRIDADSQLTPGWVDSVQRAFSDKEVSAATGPVLYHDMPAQQIGLRADERIRSVIDRLSRTHKFLFGSNMAIRRDAWEAIRDETCADEKDEMHEDIDLALHVGLRGLKIVYVSDMIGAMSARRLDDSPKAFYSYVMRFERTYKRHHVKSAAARVPIFIYLSIYFPLKALRLTYDSDEGRFSFAKLRDQLRRTSDDEEVVI